MYMQIQIANPIDHTILTTITKKSKAYWGILRRNSETMGAFTYNHRRIYSK